MRGGKVIYDGMKHPLGVIGYSRSFCGKLPLAELKKHIFSDPSRPEVLLYHCALFYRPALSNWGFCMPHRLLASLDDGEYTVDLQTVFRKTTMKVLEYHLAGDSCETLVLNAHNCHAAQANDGPSGIVVGIEVLRRLAKMAKRRFSYRLVIAPEHLGTVFYLANLPEAEAKQFKGCIFLEMLGSSGKFALQESFTGRTQLDLAAHQVLRRAFSGYVSDKFRKIIGNDETVWEAAGYEIPTLSLSRWPYPEYHSNLDTDAILSEDRLEEAVNSVLEIINILETNGVMKRQFKGLVSLSNPRYDLYLPTWDPTETPDVTARQRQWNYLMDCLPRYFNERDTVLHIAERHDLPYADVYRYIMKFKEKGLIEYFETGRLNDRWVENP
ncbi:MAG: DUF4910 domain-containing protein, partial [Syntrophales bacterium LBB04]|nr:DUF4910 domain-containing protein [Syntrophales bacterium LBB04]